MRIIMIICISLSCISLSSLSCNYKVFLCTSSWSFAYHYHAYHYHYHAQRIIACNVGIQRAPVTAHVIMVVWFYMLCMYIHTYIYVYIYICTHTYAYNIMSLSSTRYLRVQKAPGTAHMMIVVWDWCDSITHRIMYYIL
jgi:hypothetical protein